MDPAGQYTPNQPASQNLQPQGVVEEKKENGNSQIKNSLVVIMSILVMISVAAAGFFAYQTQKLAQEISRMQVASAPTPTIEAAATATAVASSTPTATPASTSNACTMEAKLCPDGTYVGRSGPNCEFAPCPTPKN